MVAAVGVSGLGGSGCLSLFAFRFGFVSGILSYPFARSRSVVASLWKSFAGGWSESLGYLAVSLGVSVPAVWVSVLSRGGEQRRGGETKKKEKILMEWCVVDDALFGGHSCSGVQAQRGGRVLAFHGTVRGVEAECVGGEQVAKDEVSVCTFPFASCVSVCKPELVWGSSGVLAVGILMDVHSMSISRPDAFKVSVFETDFLDLFRGGGFCWTHDFGSAEKRYVAVRSTSSVTSVFYLFRLRNFACVRLGRHFSFRMCGGVDGDAKELTGECVRSIGFVVSGVDSVCVPLEGFVGGEFEIVVHEIVVMDQREMYLRGFC